ncbi:hypothetical protein [Paractinoplanes atraurantiacus]|uniref:Uncharacterized protein n=1 Tax=Paractinoplanes atraurantiacus TaxID=1036182 RepID=A0A285GPA3_9ACTN|nr:hypothetical protein [Actinoplanes atraurantiacus]SNY25392.1 hypothetical protein SAMN05421748_102330 [Actinoplanes atraurantiacus]
MTLNITVITASRIYQSSDYRLSRDRQPISNSTMKLIKLQYRRFDGFVSYTGIASEEPGSPTTTAHLVMAWLEGSPDLNFYEVVERLRSRGTAYLKGLERRHGKRYRLTFIAAAFVKGKPTVAAISNFQRIDSKALPKDMPEMVTSWAALRSPKTPIIFFTGSPSAVSTPNRATLKQLLRDHGGDAARVRLGIADVNRAAARSAGPDGPISEPCTVISMDASGRGFQSYNDQGVESHHIMNGHRIDLSSALESLGLSGSPVIVNSSFGTNKPAAPPYECNRKIVNVQSVEYEIVEIDGGRPGARAFGIDQNGSVLYATGDPDGQPPYQYWTWHEEQGKRYLGYSSPDPYAAMSPAGDIVLLSEHSNQRTPLLIREAETVRLDVPHGMGEVEVAAVTTNGTTCGTIAINQDHTDGTRFRPATWNASGDISILMDLAGAESGRTVHANSDGLALVWARTGFWGRATLIWNLSSGEIQPIDDAVIPLFITSTGHLVGAGQEGTEQFPLHSTDMRTWRRVSTNLGFSPTAANDRLEITGRVKVDGYFTPFRITAPGSPQLLPALEFHHHYIRAMNDVGMMAGIANNDDHVHLLLWRPTS